MEGEKREHAENEAVLKAEDGTTCHVLLRTLPNGYVVEISQPKPDVGSTVWRVSFKGLAVYES